MSDTKTAAWNSKWLKARFRWEAAKEQQDRIMTELAEAKHELELLAPEGYNDGSIVLSLVNRSGSVDYAAMVKKFIPTVDKEPFRKAGSTFYTVQAVKEKNDAV